MPARLLTVLTILWSLPYPCHGQWHLGIELSTASYHGSSRDSSGVRGGPGSATAFGLRLERGFRRFSEALRISYANPGLAVASEGLTLSDKTMGSHVETAILTSFRVGGIGPSGAARVELGPALQLWDFGGEMRARVGGIAAASYEWAIVGRWSGRVRLEGMLSRSWFNQNEVPPEIERHPTWRYGVGIGLRYRL
jgi:hypothetical protein